MTLIVGVLPTVHDSGGRRYGVESALRDTVARLRSTVSTLHPRVLAQVGLTAALGELARQHEQRSGMTVDTELAEVGKPPSQALLYRAARELLVNAHKHSRAPWCTCNSSRQLLSVPTYLRTHLNCCIYKEPESAEVRK